jgi:hypothetical protein
MSGQSQKFLLAKDGPFLLFLPRLWFEALGVLSLLLLSLCSCSCCVASYKAVGIAFVFLIT